MKSCCDTSYLFSVYGNDSHTPLAINSFKTLSVPILITEFNQFELCNAICGTVFRKVYTEKAGEEFWHGFLIDLNLGQLQKVAVDQTQVLQKGIYLSQSQTLVGGHRAFDVLHIAAALHLKATHFFTFDQQQMRLAKAVGLKVNL
jgi:predicted nucleic acid-binding protein